MKTVKTSKTMTFAKKLLCGLAAATTLLATGAGSASAQFGGIVLAAPTDFGTVTAVGHAGDSWAELTTRTGTKRYLFAADGATNTICKPISDLQKRLLIVAIERQWPTQLMTVSAQNHVTCLVGVSIKVK